MQRSLADICLADPACLYGALRVAPIVMPGLLVRLCQQPSLMSGRKPTVAANLASGATCASAGKPHRKRRIRRRSWTCGYRRHNATDAVSRAVERFAEQRAFG